MSQNQNQAGNTFITGKSGEHFNVSCYWGANNALRFRVETSTRRTVAEDFGSASDARLHAMAL